jgi:two-component sensor histidine kinase
MQALIDYASYMPHGYCLLWDPWLVLLYVGSDLLIAVSYAAIPIALLLFLRRRPDIRYRGLVALFAAFILLCGITHIFSILILWFPFYPLHGLIKLLTGIVSTITAVALFYLVPKLVLIPSPTQLEAANMRLRSEIAAHEQTLTELRAVQNSLEAQVARRTAELREANEHLAVVSKEAVHRSKNLLSVVISLARQTARGVTDVAEFLDKLSGRLNALSSANATVLGTDQSGKAPLSDIIKAQLDPLLQTYPDRIILEGPNVTMDAEPAQQVCLALHELATNAVKYGALATESGKVEISWDTTARDGATSVTLLWRETSGAKGSQSDSEGFGTALLTRAVPSMLNGKAERSFDADGLRYTLSFPLE